MAPQTIFINGYNNHGSRSNITSRDARSVGLANPMIRPPTSEIARQDKIWVKEWAHWRHYDAILTYNFDQTGVLQLYRHEHDTDPHRLIQMTDFIKVYPSRNSSCRYEFTIEEKSGLEIVLASDNSGDRSAWITSFNMFIKMDKLVLNLESFDSISNLETKNIAKQDFSTEKQGNILLKSDLDFIKNELTIIKEQLKPNQEPDLLVKISNQLEKQNTFLEQLLSPKSVSASTFVSETLTKIPDKSISYLISTMNDKLSRLLSAIDYVTDRLSTCLKRDQDILNSQTQLANQLDKNYSQLKSLSNAFANSCKDQGTNIMDNIEDLVALLEKRFIYKPTVVHTGKSKSTDTVFDAEFQE